MYTQYLPYVKDYLIKNGGYYPADLRYNFRCKYDVFIGIGMKNDSNIRLFWLWCSICNNLKIYSD